MLLTALSVFVLYTQLQAASSLTPASKALGEACTEDKECKIAFSRCVTGSCSCKSGFIIGADGFCAPTKMSCPYSSVASSSTGLPKACTRKVTTLSTLSQHLLYTISDSCDSDSYCQLDTPVDTDFTGSGYCCTRPARSCPVGEPDLDATCSAYPIYNTLFSGAVDTASTVSGNKACNSNSHYCYPVVGGNQVLDFLCCPKECSGDQVGVGNVCYSKANVGDSCSIDDQCPVNSQCVQKAEHHCSYIIVGESYENHCPKLISDICQCNTGYVLIPSGRCEASTCGNNIVPLIDSSGATFRCDSTACPSTYFCTPDTHLCCPYPVATCRNQKGVVTTLDSGAGVPCKLGSSVKDQCGSNNFYCNPWYTYFDSTRSANAVTGVCCQNENKNTEE